MRGLPWLSLLIVFNCPSALAEFRDQDFGELSPAQAYNAIKTAVREDRQRRQSYDPKEWGRKNRAAPEYYNLHICANGAGSGFRVVPSGAQDWAISTALGRLILTEDLSSFGIPPSVWKRHLEKLDPIGVYALEAATQWVSRRDGGLDCCRFEDVTDDRIRKLEQDLLKSLVRYRAKHPGNPQFVAEGECGAGEEVAELASNQALVTFSYTPFYNFRLCQLIGVDPEDARRCVGWTSLRVTGRFAQIPQDQGTLLGVYRYVAQIPGGTIKRGEFYAKPFDGTTDKQSVRVEVN